MGDAERGPTTGERATGERAGAIQLFPRRRSSRPGIDRSFVDRSFEAELRQLYVRVMDEPVPHRLLRIVHCSLASDRNGMRATEV